MQCRAVSFWALFGASTMLWPFASLGPGAGAQQPLAKPFFVLAVLWVHWALCTEEGSVSSAPYTCTSKWFETDWPPPHAVVRKMTSYRFRSSSDENTMLVVRNRGVELFLYREPTLSGVPINYPFWWNVKRFWTCAKRTDLAFIIRIFGAIVIVHLSWNLCIAMTLVALKLFAFVFLSAVQLRATFQNCQDSQCIKGCRSGYNNPRGWNDSILPGGHCCVGFWKGHSFRNGALLSKPWQNVSIVGGEKHERRFLKSHCHHKRCATQKAWSTVLCMMFEYFWILNDFDT